MKTFLLAEITSSGDLLVWGGLVVLAILMIAARTAGRWFYKTPA